MSINKLKVSEGIFLIIAILGLFFGDDYLSAIVPPFLGLIIVNVMSIERNLSRNKEK